MRNTVVFAVMDSGNWNYEILKCRCHGLKIAKSRCYGQRKLGLILLNADVMTVESSSRPPEILKNREAKIGLQTRII